MFSHNKMKPRCGFTLIEVLVVIAIIALLVALLMPAVQSARQAARRTQCRSNLKQLGLALHNYHDVHAGFPPGVIANSDNLRDALHNGLTMLLPMLDQRAVYQRYDFNRPWRDPANLSAANVTIPVFVCPDAGTTVPQNAGIEIAATDYAFSKGNRAFLCLRGVGGGMFDVNSHVRSADVTDGLSNTFAMGEAASHISLRAAAT